MSSSPNHILLLAFLVSQAATGCVPGATDPDDQSGEGPQFVRIRTTDDFQFVENHVIIEVGGTVEWRSDSGLLHSVTPVGHDAWEEAEAEGRGVEIVEVTFTEPGAYEFECKYHSASRGMTGIITVNP